MIPKSLLKKNGVDFGIGDTQKNIRKQKYKGVLTKNDIIQGLAKLGKGAKAENAADTTIKPVQMNESLEKVYQRMRQSGLDIIPVFSNDELKGIVDIENIKEFIIVKNALD